MKIPYIYNLDYVKEQSKKELFKVVSLFAGGGGSSTGYRLAGGKILGINEFIPAAQDAYAINYPDTHIFKQDVRELNGNIILETLGIKKGELDILDGSPPCSSFSMSGLRESGWGREKLYSDSKQRTDDLFFEFTRILKEVQPKCFVAENVMGLTLGAVKELLGSQDIPLFNQESIMQSLIGSGYNVRFAVLYASDYGVPQQRPRTFFIGVRKDLDFKISYPKKLDFKITPKIVFSDIVNTEFDLQEVDISKFEIYKEALTLKPGEQSKRFFSLYKQAENRIVNTLTASTGNLSAASIIHWDNRKFTVKESIRLMGFPDDYYLGENYKNKIERLGRAVSPPVMKCIAEHIYKNILINLK